MSEFGRITLRRAVETDSELLLAWRNDLGTRQYSKSMGKVSESEHMVWLQKTLSNPLIQLFIILFDGEAAGTVRADHDTETWLLSWTVSPELRGQNIGYQAVAKVIEKLRGIIRAEVKVDNLASIRIVEKLGMQCKEVNKGMTVWTLNR